MNIKKLITIGALKLMGCDSEMRMPLTCSPIPYTRYKVQTTFGEGNCVQENFVLKEEVKLADPGVLIGLSNPSSPKLQMFADELLRPDSTVIPGSSCWKDVDLSVLSPKPYNIYPVARYQGRSIIIWSSGYVNLTFRGRLTITGAPTLSGAYSFVCVQSVIINYEQIP